MKSRIRETFGLYGDQLVSATDLNRQPGKVLDMALDGPVTITRNDNRFALLRRERVADLVSAVSGSELVTNLLAACCSVLSGGTLPPEQDYAWLHGLDSEEMTDLIEESLGSYRKAMNGESPWAELAAAIHEWEESALAAQDAEIRKAFSAKPNRKALTRPND